MKAGERIVRAAIYPGIGIARVGNSPDEFFIGAEAPGMLPGMKDGVVDEQFRYKDKKNRVKRQAARFRIYGFDASGKVVKELTLDDKEVKITWSVHVANIKANWYQFNNAMDLPIEIAMDAVQRNNKIFGTDRQQLLIDPGAHSISGKDKKGAELVGQFLDHDVPLGELRTDEKGRLIFLGGFGYSSSPVYANDISNFSNNNYWHDDVSDGPVKARVWIKGVEVETESAWVVVAPPKFAPGIAPITPLYNLGLETWGVPPPQRPSFAEDIFPIFERLSLMQWLSDNQDMVHGWKARLDFMNPEFLARLADNTPKNAAFRKRLFRRFRNPNYAVYEPDKLPVILGDGIDYPNNPRSMFAVLPGQYQVLKDWSNGNFNNKGWRREVHRKPKPLEEYPLQEQPAAMDRAALEPCLGGPFHPGIEVTWPMRQKRLYSGLFRIKAAAGLTNQDYGPLLTPEMAMSERGPLSASGPGDITRWMGLPWQSDAASCQDVYVPIDFPLPVWWPVVLPINVLTEYAYTQIMNPKLVADQREKFFGWRRDWTRGVGDVGYHAEGGYTEAMIHMVQDWKSLGFVVERKGPTDRGAKELPDSLFVETERQELDA